MAKKAEIKIETIEKEYIIPLREKCRPVPRYKKTPKAVKTIKEFLIRHMKMRDNNLKKIKIDRYLNEFLWKRGIKKPIHKIKVKAIKEGDIVRVELVNIPEKLKFKKLREERREQEAEEVGKKKKDLPEKEKEIKEKPEEEKEKKKEKEEKEKKEAITESMKEIEKAAAKTIKHQKGGKTKEPKRWIRQALQK